MRFDFDRTLRFGRTIIEFRGHWAGRAAATAARQPTLLDITLEERQRQLFSAEIIAQKRLQASLTPAQRKSIANNQWFDVVSNCGNRWRISTNRQVGNVFSISHHGAVTGQYCTMIKSREAFPPADLYLAQALTLASDEASFIDVAVHMLGGDHGYSVPVTTR